LQPAGADALFGGKGLPPYFYVGIPMPTFKTMPNYRRYYCGKVGNRLKSTLP